MKKLYIIGIGPGRYEQMTIAAVKALEACSVIVGYGVYIDLIKEHFAGKEYITTPMRKEVERCRMALLAAEKGHLTAMICSGDASVYGMAGLLYQLKGEYPEVELEVVPGVTAALSGGAVLGSPLTHDFAVISLSDLLTPWELIEQRLALSGKADFVICLYNPSSKKRADYLARACQILLEYKSGDTVCGIVRNIGRDGEDKQVLTLAELKETKVDMFTTVFIGNRQTRQLDDFMVTPRGYLV